MIGRHIILLAIGAMVLGVTFLRCAGEKPEEKPDISKQVEKPQKETPQERLKRLTGFDVYQCPKCKKGRMRVIREIPRIRSPDVFSTKPFFYISQ